MESTLANTAHVSAASDALSVRDCFHCGLPVADDLDLEVVIDAEPRPMCCHGCQAVAQAIVDAGHAQFYRVRSEPAETGQVLLPDFIRETEVYDNDEIQRQYRHSLADGASEISLMLDGITCAACLWLIEQTIARLPGVVQVRVNYATQRALLRWQPQSVRLSDILQAIHRVGYRALPFDPQQQQLRDQHERRRQLRRLAVAGLFGMQVMMLSISLYAGAWSSMEEGFVQLFRWLGLVLTLPVVGYAALPFLRAAWRDLARRRVSMDLPVSIAILGAFASSCVATVSGSGEVYFDSVVMFVFFLSASRYFESMARQRCAASVEKLAQGLPLTALRLDDDSDQTSAVAANSLQPGDRVLLRPGDTVPADGVVVHGYSALDESLLSGESTPLDKGPGAALLGGSINVSNPLQMEVSATGADTVMAEIQRNIERAQADKPPLARLADRVAGWFISLVLIIVTLVSAYWWSVGSAQWFDIGLAVLIVSCPCALSLATPTAISAVLGRLQGRGLLVKRSAALEALGRVTHVVFDKTGTLTRGVPVVDEIRCARRETQDNCLRLAAALENQSAHPLARAITLAAGSPEPLATSAVKSVAGGGMHGCVAGRDYWIGSIEFVRREAGVDLPAEWSGCLEQQALTAVVLAGTGEALALFTFTDELRDDAVATVEALQTLGKEVLLMSGDRSSVVQQVARQTSIADYHAQLSPADKIEAVNSLQAQGAVVLMIGDGINDAPVLAGADVSIAMAGASALAKVNADMVLLRDRLDGIVQVFAMAARTRRVIGQNMGWALAYNFGAIPAAALGMVAPWLAALGMSLSSLLVVVNALRLTRE